MHFQRLYFLRLIIPLFAFILIAGCSDDDGTGPDPGPASNPPGVYIINEGNFNSGNSSLSYFIPDSTRVINRVYETATGNPLGDVGHSLSIHNGLLYIVVNNSDKIEVIDIKDHSHVRTIQLEDGASPRFMLFTPLVKAYISNMGLGSVSVYDPASNSLDPWQLKVGNNPEQMAYHSNHVYVTNSGFGNGNTVSVINISSDTVINTFQVGDGPVAIAKATPRYMGILCNGSYGEDYTDPSDDTPGQLFVYDLISKTVKDSIHIGGHPHNLVPFENKLLTCGETGIHLLDVETMQIQRNFLTGTFYTVEYDKARERIYATDAKDYQTPGEVYVYSTGGMLLYKLGLDIIPSRMAITP